VIAESAFRPAWWLPGPHLQTLYPSLFRRRRHPELKRERLELPDGDFLDLDWTRNDGRALVLVLHGLEGSLESHYTGAILEVLVAEGYRAVLMYFRGCSGEPNRLARSYHSGDTADLRFVIAYLAGRLAAKPLAVIGYSLGGNVLLKALGEGAGMESIRTGGPAPRAGLLTDLPALPARQVAPLLPREAANPRHAGRRRAARCTGYLPPIRQ
jgi:predicted alpha/beta-fold hydrolase